jgi:hypothetical protein
MFKGIYDLIVLIIIGYSIYVDKTIFKDFPFDWFTDGLRYFVMIFVLLGIRRIVFGKWIR